MQTITDYQVERRKVLSPFFDWDGQIARCYEMEGWEMARVEEAVAAFHYLRGVLGEDFPMYVLDQDHPMGQYFVNNVPWAKEWFIRLALSLQQLAGSHHFKKIFSDLCSSDPARFADAEMLLHYGSKFLQAGYQVDFEVMQPNKRGQAKFPDLKLTDKVAGDIYYCEFSRLTKDPLTKLYESVIERIVHGGMREAKKALKFSGALYQRVPEKNFGEIASAIQQLVRRTCADGKLHEWRKEGFIKLAVADYHDPAIQSWATTHNLEVNAWQYPSADPYRRMKNKLWRKASQASAGFPTFLIIKMEDEGCRFIQPAVWIGELDQTLQQCQDVMAVWLTIYEFGNLEKAMQNIGVHYFIKRTEGYAIGSISLVILNRHYHDADSGKWHELFKKLL